MMMTGEVRLFGGFRLETAEQSPITLTGRKERELMAAIAMDQGQAVSRDRLVSDLWDRDDFSARRSLNTALWRLRKSVREAGVDCEDWFDTGTDYIRLRRRRGPEVDVINLQEDIQNFRKGQIAPTIVAKQLTNLAGAFLPDITAEWIEERRRTIEHDRVRASVDIADALLESEPNWAIEVTNAAIRVDPYEEAAWRALISAYLLSGREAQAHATYSKLTALLSEDLGIAPSTETQALFDIRPVPRLEPAAVNIPMDSQTLSARLETMAHALSIVMAELESIREELAKV